MKKGDVAVYLTLGLLLAAIAVLALLNRGDAQLRRALEENREFMVETGGSGAAGVDLRKILDLSPESFSATFATGSTLPREATFRGVELKTLLGSLGIDTSAAKHIIVSGLDGYYATLTMPEVERDENVYICYEMDGEILKPQSEGGYGPFLLVIRSERFAQRWCKYVKTVNVVY